MGAGNFTGALADFLAAVDGSNLGGGHRAGAGRPPWCAGCARWSASPKARAYAHQRRLGRQPVALTVARNVKAAEAGVDVRAAGVTALPRPLRFYASEQVHSCHQKALEVLGLGRAALHLVATDAGHRIDLAAALGRG